MTKLGWLYWILLQLTSLAGRIAGLLPLFALSVAKSWHERPGRSKHYPDRFVMAWNTAEAILAGALLDGTLGLAVSPSFSLWTAGAGVICGASGIWNNEEDGVVGADWYLKQYAHRPEWFNAFLWSAWRNSTNNLRFLPGAFFVIDRRQLAIRDGPLLTVVTHGWRQSVTWKGWPFPIRFGWLLRADQATGDYAWPVLERL